MLLYLPYYIVYVIHLSLFASFFSLLSHYVSGPSVPFLVI